MTEDQFFMLCLFIAIIALLIGWMSTGYKSQGIRVMDVLVWGPLVIFCAFVRNIWTTLILIFIAASTMSYNLKNYLVQGGYMI